MNRIHSVQSPLSRRLAILAVSALGFCFIAPAGCSSNDAFDAGLPEADRKGPAFDEKALEKLTPKQRKLIEKANIQRDS